MTPGDTWLGVLLDGLIGGIIGGGATGLAVWATLRHTTRSDRLQAARASATELHAVATLLAQEIAATVPDDLKSATRDRWATEHRRIQVLALDLGARLIDNESEAAAVLEEHRTELMMVVHNRSTDFMESRNDLLSALASISSFAMAWVTEPQQFRDPRIPRIRLKRN